MCHLCRGSEISVGRYAYIMWRKDEDLYDIGLVANSTYADERRRIAHGELLRGGFCTRRFARWLDKQGPLLSRPILPLYPILRHTPRVVNFICCVRAYYTRLLYPRSRVD